ncbi:maleylpyruvate isomerase N-terminal domain-containing protein [Mycolicibacterium sp. CBM1]
MTLQPLDEQIALYRVAGEHAVDLVARIPAHTWDTPVLGVWTVRTLVGHLSRSFVTVVDYLARPAAQRDVHTTGDYYLAAANVADAGSIQARAEQAGRALGADPPAEFRRLRDQALDALASADDPLITTIVGGMLLSDYLPTRIVELAVHSLDLAAGLGLAAALPADVCTVALTVAVETAGRRGDGQELLLALTGRAALPPGFSVV